MVDERLHFAGENAAYQAFYAIQHLARYHLLQRKCKDKRVLDVACGEGFGSYLIAEWGAAAVVGVDVSAEAIARAREYFGHERVRFLQGNAECLDSLLSGEPPFDVLACFETIEHLRLPTAFFEAARRLLKPEALIVISCPNDKCALDQNQDNPYHVAEYTLEEFQRLTTGHLGAARQWLIGTPVNGMVAIDLSEQHLLQPGVDMTDLIKATAAQDSALAMAPAQANQAPTTETCLYFVGVWGDELPLAATVAPVSYRAFIEPWSLIEYLKKQQAGTEADLSQVRGELAIEIDMRVSLVAAAANERALAARESLVGRETVTALNAELDQARDDLQTEIQSRRALAAVAADDRALAAREQFAYRQQLDALSAARAAACAEVALLEAKCARSDIAFARLQVSLAQMDAARSATKALLAGEREQIAAYREWVPSYRWLFGHFRRKLFGRGIFLLPPIRPNEDKPRTTPLPTPASETDEDRILIERSGLFNPEYYGDRYPDLAGMDLLAHYITHGGREGRSPGPDFDGRWYLSRNPDVARSRENPLAHYLRRGAREGRSPAPDPAIFTTAARVLEDVSMFDTEISNRIAIDNVKALEVLQGLSHTALYNTWNVLFDSLPRSYEYIIFVPWLVRGGADLVAATAARAVVERHGAEAVLFVITDYHRVDARDWVPPGVCVRILSEITPDLSHDDRVRIVEMLIFALCPRAILNVNSRACWDAIKLRGAALSRMTQLFAFFFCRDYSVDGRAAGYADTHFRSCFPHLKKAYFDNQAFAHTMISEHGIPEPLTRGVAVLRQPAPDRVKSGLQRGDQMGRPLVLWAGRFCLQKNVDLLIEIAARSPKFQFHVYGEGEDDIAERLRQAERQLRNLTLCGPFASFDSLATDEYSSFLFTSLWEGIPTSLVYAGSLGIPIVASAVGGVPELVDDETGWLIRDHTCPGPYLKALEEIWSNPGEATRRVERMLERVRSQHSWTVYMDTFSETPSFLHGCPR